MSAIVPRKVVMSKELRELIIAQVRVISADDNAMFFPDTYADRIMQLLETTPAKEKRELADKMMECLPQTILYETHRCSFKAHKVKPESEGYKDYSSLPDSWYTCDCDRPMRKAIYSEPQPTIDVFNRAVDQIRTAMDKIIKEIE